MPSLRRRRPFLLACCAGVVLSGCAGGGAAAEPPAAHRAGVAPIVAHGSTCPAIVANTLGAVARRIYGQAAHGRNVVAARRRLARSRLLSAAVAAADPRATRAALVPLLKHQIRQMVLTRGAHVLATIHGPPALAPVHGVIRDAAGHPVGRYVLSVADAAAVLSITRTLTGATVELARGGLGSPARVAASGRGGAGATMGFAVRTFPAGERTERLVVSGAMLHTVPCAASPSATVAATVGAIGRRLFADESRGGSVVRVLRHVTADPGFRAAVAADDPIGLRAAIIRFFRTRSLHVVRVRATTADGRLVGDVGGPDVLAPASAPVRDAHGRLLGTVTLAVQDDTGYIKLMRRFTGAAVLLRTPTAQIVGSTLTPGPPVLPPSSGVVTYRGRRYEVSSFTARAFPTGPLTIALLL